MIDATATRYTGRITRWVSERGFGYVRVATDGRLAFVHHVEVAGLRDDRDHPEPGDLLEFRVVQTEKGPRAVDARIIRRAGDER
jgi:cold shock CspA family protein